MMKAMTRPGKTWTSYSRLIGALGQRYGGPLLFVLGDKAQPQEKKWTVQLSTELRPSHPDRQEVQDLLAGLDIGEGQFQYHLKAIARWGRERRRLLREGGNFQLLESLKADDARLKGLSLSGKAHAQRRQLAQHLKTDELKFEGQGWLPPVANPPTGSHPRQRRPLRGRNDHRRAFRPD